jgi:hypothetical protein
MSTEHDQLSSREAASELPGAPHDGIGSTERPVSRIWIIVGCAALLLGLAMGLIMSSLGK